MTGTVVTVRGEITAEELGLVLPHEHLFNDLSSCVVKPTYEFSRFLPGRPVEPSMQWALKHDPYCNDDNVSTKPLADVVREVQTFQESGGMTIIDATGSDAIGRDPEALRAVAEATGLNIVMSTGAYLSKFEQERLTAGSVDGLASQLLADIRYGVRDTGIRAGMIGEAGVSPSFTEGERTSVRASALAQAESPATALNIHMPGWQRRGDEVLDIAIDEMGANPSKISLAHSDPSGTDVAYQRRLLDRGVWLEFDMVGLDISFPGEGVSPTIHETADAVAGLIELGYADQLLLSHDLFLKQMWAAMGGNGFTVVPTAFLELLVGRGVSRATAQRLITVNPQRYLGAAPSV